MRVRYTIKRHHKIIVKELHPLYMDALLLCLNSLKSHGVKANVHVIFQTGRSKTHSRVYGSCQCVGGSDYVIRIYTWKRRVMTNVTTIGHEFGHVAHFELYEESRSWTRDQCEKYAIHYERQVVNRLSKA